MIFCKNNVSFVFVTCECPNYFNSNMLVLWMIRILHINICNKYCIIRKKFVTLQNICCSYKLYT